MHLSCAAIMQFGSRAQFPKGTDLSGYHPDYLAFVAHELNDRPRKTLGWKTPAEPTPAPSRW
jgi:IS30 family transposase